MPNYIQLSFGHKKIYSSTQNDALQLSTRKIITTTTKYEDAPRQNDVTRVLHDDMKKSSTYGRVVLNLTTVSQATGRATLNPTTHQALEEVRNQHFLSLPTL